MARNLISLPKNVFSDEIFFLAIDLGFARNNFVAKDNFGDEISSLIIYNDEKLAFLATKLTSFATKFLTNSEEIIPCQKGGMGVEIDFRRQRSLW